MEGHFTLGVGDGNNSPETPIEILPGTLDEALAIVEARDESKRRLERVTQLIEGFETPLGMELLATVHWAMNHGACPDELDSVMNKVQSWNDRKRSLMKPAHIRSAWQRLCEQGWNESAAVTPNKSLAAS